MGVPLADTVAIGDSDNDLTVNEVAGIGIAMGNGEQCAKDAADAVDASGLAHAFERLGVVERPQPAHGTAFRQGA